MLQNKHLKENILMGPGMVVDVFNPRAQEADLSGFLWVQGQPDLYIKLQASQCCRVKRK